CAENMEYLININYCLWRIHEVPYLISTYSTANWQWDVDDFYFYTHDLNLTSTGLPWAQVLRAPQRRQIRARECFTKN
ncbi:MAG: hypothetical protein PHG67_14320, partial [Bacteroidales bacterium]|nr:hypothetical protein [Bacteroidales bacterium]